MISNISKRFECKSFQEIIRLFSCKRSRIVEQWKCFVFFSFGRAYRNTGGGEACPEHFNVTIDPKWPTSTIIFGPESVFGGTLFTGSLVNEVEKLKIRYRKNRIKPGKLRLDQNLSKRCLFMWDVSAPTCQQCLCLFVRIWKYCIQEKWVTVIFLTAFGPLLSIINHQSNHHSTHLPDACI